MQPEQLKAALDRHPTVKLANLPTPLEPLARLSRMLGGPKLWIKRDDLTGLAFGGNKTRQLEYVLAEALARGCDSIVIGAYTQSNWCRQAVAAAARMGLHISLVLLRGEKGAKLQGNLLLNRLMGADVTIVDIDSMEALQPILDAKAATLRAKGGIPFMVEPLGLDSLSLGALGYIGAALELDAQFKRLKIEPTHLYLCGANMTPAGLALGFKALGRVLRIRNIAPIQWSMPRAEDIVRIANATAARLDIETRLDPMDFDSRDDFIGERYGIVSKAGLTALKLLARTEAIILDPVYSSKAMAGMLHDIKSGWLTSDQTAVFVHTGGTPALFAYAEDLELA